MELSVYLEETIIYLDISSKQEILEAVSNVNLVEIMTCLAEVAMAIAAWYGICSLKSWIRQTTVTRRADTAREVLEELEFFYIRLEQLVQWEYLLGWEKWGPSFNEIFRSNFLIAKFKAQRLKNSEVNSLLESMEKAATGLPTNQRMGTQVIEGTGQLFWPKEAPAAKEKFTQSWKAYQEKWQSLRQILLSAGLYDSKDL